jgi:site-specific recombinase XerD
MRSSKATGKKKEKTHENQENSKKLLTYFLDFWESYFRKEVVQMEKERKVEELITLTLKKMRENKYSESHIFTYERVYSSLKTYCRNTSDGMYSEELGKIFIQVFDQRRPTQNTDTLGVYKSAIRRLNFTLSGIEWQPEGRPDIAYAVSCFESVVCEYELYLYRAGKTKKNTRIRVHTVSRFLQNAERKGCKTLNDITADCIYEAFQESTDKNGFRNSVGAFLRYAHTYELIASNLFLIVPFVPRHKSIPAVYSPDEVEQLLICVDRETVTGKRNYAIILIASRLGLRASDIAALKLDSLYFAQGKIAIKQIKGKEPLLLPLVHEVRAAIDDYINNARPETTDRYLFQKVRGSGKISPDSVGQIVHTAFEHSDIALKERKSGSHALRSSLATALLAEGNDYETIRGVLGHKNVQTSEHYVAANAEQLRVCALKTPLPAGNFASLLKAGAENV